MSARPRERVTRWKTASCGCIFNQYSAISIRFFPALPLWLREPWSCPLRFLYDSCCEFHWPSRWRFSVRRYQNELPKKIKSRGKDAHLNHEELVQTMKWKQIVSRWFLFLFFLVSSSCSIRISSIRTSVTLLLIRMNFFKSCNTLRAVMKLFRCFTTMLTSYQKYIERKIETQFI